MLLLDDFYHRAAAGWIYTVQGEDEPSCDLDVDLGGQKGRESMAALCLSLAISGMGPIGSTSRTSAVWDCWPAADKAAHLQRSMK